MSVDIDVSSSRVRAPMTKGLVVRIASAVLRSEGVTSALLSITFVSAPAIRRLNARHLGHDRPTDVIAFGFDRPTARDPVIGDVYISPFIAARQARVRGIPRREELLRLIVHGTLHVVGYDHPVLRREVSPMWKRQERLVSRLAPKFAA